MPTSVGPKTVAEDSLVFAFDQDYFPHGWGLEQLAYNPTFEESGTKPSGPSVYSSGNYLGAMTQSIMQGGTFSYTGGDLSNYYSTNPEWRGWDNGGIGSTGGNWVYFNDILPLATSSLEDYIVDVRLRFVYVSLTGNGSTNPYVQIGRAYNNFKSIYYNEVGTDFKRIRFKFNGAQGNNYGGNNRDLTFGCTSADAMVEMDHFYVYRINKSTGLKDLTGNSTIDLTNVSFDSNGRVDLDGSDDRIDVGLYHLSGSSHSEEVVIYRGSTGTTHGILSDLQYGFYGLYVDSNNRVYYRQMQQNPGEDPEYPSVTIAGSTALGVGYYHIVGTFSKTDGFKLYVNGELEASNSTILPFNLSGNRGINHIGVYKTQSASTYSNPFDGRIELVKAYNRALTASEIKANFNAIKGRFNI